MLPYGVWTIPEIATVGESEESLLARGVPFEVGRASFRTNARGQIIGDVRRLREAPVRSRDQRVLGVTIVGEGACELIHVGMTVIALEGTLDFFIQAAFGFPSLGEAYKYAAYDGLQQLQRRHARQREAAVGAARDRARRARPDERQPPQPRGAARGVAGCWRPERRDNVGPMSPPLELSTSALGSAERRERPTFAFVAERLWLDFVNTDTGVRGADALHDFERFVLWLEAAHVLDAERSATMRRRSEQQPAGALAVLGDARRVRTVLRALAERGVVRRRRARSPR